MEILSSSLSSKFSTSPFFRSLTTKNPYKFRTTHLKPFTNSPFLTILPLKIRCYPLVFSRFGGPRKRRNSLRKKLKGNGGPQVRQNPQKINDPVHQFVDNQSSDSITSSNDSGLEKGSFIMNEKRLNLENSGKFGENVMWDKLEGWVEQYKKDIEFWGIGSNPIFTVFQDSSGNFEKVLVDEDEIIRRIGFKPFRFREERVMEEINEVNSKVSYANSLAKELECGKNVIPRNSSVTKFVSSGEKLGFVGTIRSVFVPRKSLANVSRVGIAVVCGFVLVWLVRKVCSMRVKEVELTSFEKEMLRRKMKSRMAKEKLQIGNVEVVEEPVERPIVVTERPWIDKEEVLNMIREANGLSESLVALDVGGSRESGPTNMDSKIEEIRMMARNARKIERGEESPSERNGLDEGISENIHLEEKGTIENFEDLSLVDEVEKEASIVPPFVGKDVDNVSRLNVSKMETLGNLDTVSEGNVDLGPLSKPSGRITDDEKSHMNGVTHSHDMSSSELNSPKKTPKKRKVKIICSVKEAREYLSKKLEVGDVPTSSDISRMGEKNREPESFEEVSQFYNIEQNELLPNDASELGTKSELNQNSPRKSNEIFKLNDSHERSDFVANEEENQPHLTTQSVEKVDNLDETLKPTVLSENSDLDFGIHATHNESTFHVANKELHFSDDNDKVKVNGINGRDIDGSDFKDEEVLSTDINGEDDYCENKVENEFSTSQTFVGHGNGVDNMERGLVAEKEKWLEKNFHEVEPIVKKIGSGFRNSYNVAREKIKEDVDTKFDLMKLSSINDETELEWMEDDKLREIVFKVRDNELAGRDPFDSMDPQDKIAFFEGLERKVEKENEKLSMLHEWLQSNIENFDYGADGISIYDPPEKVIPRWKGPPLDTIPEFLNNTKNQQSESSLQTANESTKHESNETSPIISTSKSPHKGKSSKVSRTVIEASDGSIKPGKKSGKEFWQHTKKWTRGFLESYNAETDPEVKSVMRDIGKDLDRWITEKEIKEAGELMDKLPQHKKVIQNKLNKLKREMELFGPQAVVSKYREYAEEKEQDYLWWLDLPHLLCIELYTYEGEDQRVGFYSLEMAEDLELEPKPRHVIAFQDPGDCKNFCYIIQAHLEMIGKGKAFIVPQPPKDVYRQAKGDGFGVTVIRKGEVKMNVDQPLEEVEELIIEIGSKMYHDKIMGERSLDISSLMKGVFGSSLPSNRRKRKRARKRPSKS